MKRIFIGHRGVGKTSLLDRHQKYFPYIQHFDLDRYIADHEKSSVSDIFQKHGENYFRNLEQSYFQKLIQLKEFVISLGAGFDVASLKNILANDVEIIYVSRRTDSDGRLFLNRPRLDDKLTPLQEYQNRFQIREPKFRDVAHWIYHLPEGISQSNIVEQKLLEKKISLKKCYYTLLNAAELKWMHHLNRFELRTDYYSTDDISKIIREYPNAHFMISIRKIEDTYNQYLTYKNTNVMVDWALELGDWNSKTLPAIFSVHGESFDQAFEAIKLQSHSGTHLKFCPVVTTIQELKAGYHWQEQDSQNRSFLPRTHLKFNEKSLWRWFRCLMFNRQKINFVQSRIAMDDQPSLYQYLQFETRSSEYFGAVMGLPVHHSRTPVYQNQLDLSKIPYVDIPVEKSQFIETIEFGQNLGLKFIAVTSPLKFEASEFLKSNPTAGTNTLFLNGQKWIGTSTDHLGFESLIGENALVVKNQNSIALWGGGGVSDAIQQIIPNLIHYSSRTGQPKSQSAPSSFSPTVLIWAAPRMPGTTMPPQEWRPQMIIDLNYAENSMGLEYAQTLPNVTYVSGLKMFESQGLEQHKFWSKHMKTKENI